MGAVRFISSRLRLKGRIATLCVSISFLIVVLAVCISAGFQGELRSNLSKVSGDIRITSRNMDYMSDSSPVSTDSEYLDYVRRLECVDTVENFIYRTGIVKHHDTIHGVIFKGNEQQDSLTITIPQSLADLLEYNEGDNALVYFVGETVKVRKFKITGIYQDVVGVDDYCLVHASIKDLRRLNGWNPNQASAIEIRLTKDYQSYDKTKEAYGLVATICSQISSEEERVVARSIIQEYPNIFDWLRLIDFNVLLVVIIMIIVAAFNMCSGLLIILFEHISMIGLLKALGMTNRKITGIFLASSSRIMVKGMLTGNAVALLFCFFQYKTHFMHLDPANYFVEYVPIAFPWLDVLWINLACYVVLMIVMLLPTLFISKVDPAKTMKIN